MTLVNEGDVVGFRGCIERHHTFLKVVAGGAEMNGNHGRIQKGRQFNEIQREGQIGYPNKTSNSWNAGNYDQIRSGKRLKSYSAIDTRPLTKVLEVQMGLVACWVYSSC
jgi:hypothetical protein